MIELPETKKLLSKESEYLEKQELLSQVLRSCIELVSLDDNDFSWSSWGNKENAIEELQKLLLIAENQGFPELSVLSSIFAPTGPLQELSLSSGWGNVFLKVSEKYDIAENQIWN